ncbi:MAG: hypothetical protein RL757_704 [Bacteroidota bacterium]|jgi:hypothetical protein
MVLFKIANCFQTLIRKKKGEEGRFFSKNVTKIKIILINKKSNTLFLKCLTNR